MFLMEYIGYVLAQVKRSGNSFVIRVPREEMERIGVAPDEYVEVQIRAVDVRPRLTVTLRTVAEDVLAHPETVEALARLADA
jgi:antitoxin component of MazEF toxin-antitoxin module